MRQPLDRLDQVENVEDRSAGKALFLLYIHVNQKMISMYSLDCSFFDREFHTIAELIDHVINFGCDPNYEITKDGKGIGEQAWDYIQC